ncbi:MAG: nucleotide pyrophosphohydrolase [Candidatus Atribacteria bacterium]|nr:nucleotide pyrophosphohydrolase [Candidatus Atribacteria bacterium]
MDQKPGNNHSDKTDNQTTIKELKEKIKYFCELREWDQFHNAKELTIGIVTEASELLQHFRFKSADEVDAMFHNSKKQELTEEMADIFFFLIRLAQRYDIDLTTELKDKMNKNNKKYPVEKAKGSNKKYSEF